MNDGIMMSRRWMPASHGKHLRLKRFYFSSPVVSVYPFSSSFFLFPQSTRTFCTIVRLHRPDFGPSYLYKKKDI